MTAPEWLTKRDGLVMPGSMVGVWMIMLAGKPQYRLDLRPVGGLVSCAIVQTMNGQRLDGDTKYANTEAALAGGLEQLRAKLGW